MPIQTRLLYHKNTFFARKTRHFQRFFRLFRHMHRILSVRGESKKAVHSSCCLLSICYTLRKPIDIVSCINVRDSPSGEYNRGALRGGVRLTSAYSVAAMTAFIVCRRFSASSKTSERPLSNTLSVTSRQDTPNLSYIARPVSVPRS